MSPPDTPSNLPAQRPPLDLSPTTFEQALQFADRLAESELVPKDYQRKPANCLIAMQWGAEVGLKPLQALSSIAVINGRACMWGDALLAMVRSSPLCEWVMESDDGATATCRVKRRGDPEPQVRTFSMDDARQAGLLNKAGPWTQYPKRMRQMRARAFALRDVFPDVLRGLSVAEEQDDVPKDMGAADVVGAPPPPAPAPAAAPRPELQAYPEEAFAANLATWKAVIESGRKTAEDIINMASTKGVLSEDQRRRVRNLVVIDNETGEIGGGAQR